MEYIPYNSNILNITKTEPYYEIGYNYKFSCKNGQLKLLLAELEFYTHIHKIGIRHVVYVGSAPGTHSVKLVKLFEDMQFLFVDPRQFCPSLKNLKNVTIVNAFFTENFKIPFDQFAFISDVRTGSGNQQIIHDMELQKSWVLHFKPVISMLKFRLPWTPGKTVYFGGDIHLQAYTSPMSTETRLWVTSLDLIEWDNDQYQNAMFYFNKNCKMAKYDCKMLDACHNCWLFSEITKPWPEVDFLEGYDLTQGAHGMFMDCTAEERYHKLQPLMEQIEENRINFSKKRQKSLKEKDEKQNFYIEKIKKLRSTLDFPVLKAKGLLQYKDEFELAQFYINKFQLNTVITTDYAADYIGELCGKFPHIKFTVHYTHFFVAEYHENLLIIYEKAKSIPKDTLFLNFCGYFVQAHYPAVVFGNYGYVLKNSKKKCREFF